MRLVITLFTTILLTTNAFADEGMWLPSLIQERIGDMQSKGLKLSAEDIYSINKSCLKDAIVRFGNGCTAEIISNEGLLLTNHHCGYTHIQSHSSLQNDYLTNGFWAMNRTEELPNKDLTVRFLVRMEDVTDKVLDGITPKTKESNREDIIKINSQKIINTTVENSDYVASIEPFYYGNQYFMFVYEEYKDVRLVAAPPSSIGKFGGDTDNWIWPRHTGDFSVFRIYADKNNRPAEYSRDNQPYQPKRSLEISTKGVEKGDFTFIYGFPGKTSRYVTSSAVDYIVNRGNPHKINLRAIRLEIMNREQALNPQTRIKYASKNASVANAWKKWQGESKGILRLGVIDQKLNQEAEYRQWASANGKQEYINTLDSLNLLYSQISDYALIKDYCTEALKVIEITKFASKISTLTNSDTLLNIRANEFYKDYSSTIDSLTAEKMLIEFMRNIPTQYQNRELNELIDSCGGVELFVQNLFINSALSSTPKFARLAQLSVYDYNAAITRDPAIKLSKIIDRFESSIKLPYDRLNTKIESLYRTYMKGLIEKSPQERFFPDANLTLRVAYGYINGYKPFDGAYYTHSTTLKGIIEKDNPLIYDYNVPQKLRDIYTTGDFGRYVNKDGNIPVAFLATNHTTGGNSGSPVLNDKGQLIGLNFDRTWESTMSDIQFDSEMCRNIAVDIHYILFILDKLGGVSYLFDEMQFAQ